MRAQRQILSISFVLIFILTFQTAAPISNAQALTAGTVSGSVVDPNGATVPNATVTIANSITGYKRTVTTDAEGNFRFTDVPPNNYQLTVSALGFSAANQTLTVRTAVPIALKIPLEVSSATETVNVTSNAAQARATAATRSGTAVPGLPAQPPFSIIERRSQDGALLNATSFAAASVCCWNFSTQIGASAATTAVSARWLAIFSAVLPSVHPSDENPTTANATAPPIAPHTAGFTMGWIFIASPRL